MRRGHWAALVARHALTKRVDVGQRDRAVVGVVEAAAFRVDLDMHGLVSDDVCVQIRASQSCPRSA